MLADNCKGMNNVMLTEVGAAAYPASQHMPSSQGQLVNLNLRLDFAQHSLLATFNPRLDCASIPCLQTSASGSTVHRIPCLRRVCQACLLQLHQTQCCTALSSYPPASCWALSPLQCASSPDPELSHRLITHHLNL